MLKKLKRTFVLLCTGLTGLVLLAACLLGFNMTRAEVESTGQAAFESQSQTLGVLLAGTKRLDHSQVTRMEREGGVLIYLFDNGQPLRIAGGGDAALRGELYDAALAALAAADAGGAVAPEAFSGEPANVSAGFRHGGEGYRAKYLSTPTSARSWTSVVLVKPAAQDREIGRIAAIYAGIYLAGLLLLGFISWLLARRSVRPVEDAQQRQKEFIAAASHELKGPLAVITSGVDVLEGGAADPARQLGSIRQEAKRMAGLVEDLLLLAGMETGRWHIKKAPANMEDLLAAACERFLPVAGQQGRALRLVLPEGSLPAMEVDEARILQVLAILLSNAVSYSPPGTEILLEGAVAGRELVLTVADHGPGIPDADKARVFDSFYRAQSAHSDKGHFGLGLAVAKGLVAQHGGTIAAKDTPGGGATFEVRLPKA